MSLSDCPKCWDTPCICGHEYRNWTPDRLRELIRVLEDTLTAKEAILAKRARETNDDNNQGAKV